MLALLKTLAGPFYSASFYRDLVFKGRGFGATFLIAATLLSLIPFSRQPTLDAFFQNKKAIFASLPDMEIKGGKLNVSAPTPLTYPLLTAEQGGPLNVVIDLEAKMDDEAVLRQRMDDEHIAILVGAGGLAMTDKTGGKLSVTSFEKSEDKHFTAQTWHDMNEVTDLFFGAGALGVLLFFGFMFHIFTALIGAGFMVPVSRLVSEPLPYGVSFRLVMATKLPVAAVAALPLTPIPSLQVLVWFGFAAFALLALRSKQVGNSPEIQ